MNNKEAIILAIRYIVLVVLGFALIYGKLFEIIFTPLTFWPVLGILHLFYDNVASLPGYVISYANVYAGIIPACIAGAAYYLLLILNLTTPMKAMKRAWSILFLVGAFLIFNIMRIVIFAAVAASRSNYFDAAHMMMWYFGSTVMVVIIWFLTVWLFKIKEIPVYSDMKSLYEDAVPRRRKK